MSGRSHRDPPLPAGWTRYKGETLSALCVLLVATPLHACRPATPPPATTLVETLANAVLDAGGVSLHIHCVGHGSPIVVFDSGLGSDGTVWAKVQPEVGTIAEACVYDRAGMGRSGPGPRPRTSQRMVLELHALLASARLAGPFVLVGHSLGGLNVRLYAATYPAEVVGMVLVDATTENQDSRFWSLLPSQKLHEFQAGLGTLPDGIDYDSFRESMAQVRAAQRSLGSTPLVVLTHGRDDPPAPGDPPELAAHMRKVWSEMQAELPALSANSAQVVATTSRHFIQLDNPKLVVGAVREVVRAARTHSPLDGPALTLLAR